jgi:hypothetical protein
MVTKNKMRSAYPGDVPDRILVGSSQNYNRALRCFGWLLAGATRRNENLFDADEWGVLRELLTTFDTSGDNPGALGSAMVAMLERPGWTRPWNTLGLRHKLGTLDALHIWAIVWCVEYSKAHPEIEDWWKLEWRTKKERGTA